MERIDQASLGVSRLLLRVLPCDRIVVRRRKNYSLYAQQFNDMLGTHSLLPKLPLQTVPHVFPVWFDAADEVYAGLASSGSAGIPLGSDLARYANRSPQ